MPDWLIEGDPVALLLLGVLALCTGVAWRKTGRKSLLAIAGLSVCLIITLLVSDRVFESDGEQIKRKVSEVAAEVKRPLDIKKLFRNISASFSYGRHDKDSFQKYCESVIPGRQVSELKIWDYATEELSRPHKKAKIRFQFKVRADAAGLADGAYFLCKAEAALDADNQWRLLTFKVYPLSGGDQLPIPQLE